MNNFLTTSLKKLAILTDRNLDPVSLNELREEINNISSIDIESLSYEKNIDIYKFFIKMLNNISAVPDLESKLNDLLNVIEGKFEYINKRIRVSLYEKIKSARLLNDYTIQKQTLAFDININPQTFEKMTGTIIDGSILAIKSKDNGSQKLIDTEIIKDIQVEGNNGPSSIGGTIVKKVNNGWGVANKEEVIKSEGTYLAKTQSIFDEENEITISINFGRITNVEAITPVFANPEVIKIYTSDNDKDFSLIAYKVITKNKTFILENKRIKNIKIVINKKSPSYKLGNTYIYETMFKQIKISSDYEKEDVTFETKQININKEISKLAITTNDNYDSKDVEIKYYVSMDNKEYQELRPSGKLNNKNISSILEAEQSTENKLITISAYEQVDTNFVYSLEIPQAFIMTNNMSVFNELNKWKANEGIYEAYVFNYEAKNINIGNKFIFINGKKHTGSIVLEKGINKIEIPAEFFVNLFNKKLCKSYSINEDIITITLNSGDIVTVTDTSYPYNVKLNIEENSDFVFQKLKEEVDFKFILINNNIKIQTFKSNDAVYCVYNNLYKNVQSIKIKGTMKSINNKTIPKIQKITVRVE